MLLYKEDLSIDSEYSGFNIMSYISVYYYILLNGIKPSQEFVLIKVDYYF
jgi:hypothetical protein